MSDLKEKRKNNIISLNSVELFVFVMEMDCISCEVRNKCCVLLKDELWAPLLPTVHHSGNIWQRAKGLWILKRYNARV